MIDLSSLAMSAGMGFAAGTLLSVVSGVVRACAGTIYAAFDFNNKEV